MPRSKWLVSGRMNIYIGYWRSNDWEYEVSAVDKVMAINKAKYKASLDFGHVSKYINSSNYYKRATKLN